MDTIRGRFRERFGVGVGGKKWRRRSELLLFRGWSRASTNRNCNVLIKTHPDPD